MNVASFKEQSFPAGTIVLEPQFGHTYLVFISAENGGATSVLIKLDPSHTNGVAPEFFTSGEAFGARVGIPQGGVLEVVLAGEETITFIKASDLSN